MAIAKSHEGNHTRPNSAERRDAKILIDRLPDPRRGKATTLDSYERVRIDMQGHTRAGEYNIQIQLNGRSGKTTIATVLLDSQYDAARFLGEVKEALKLSMKDGYVYRVRA